MSFLTVRAISDVIRCMLFPVSASFCLLRNHNGKLAEFGSLIIVSIDCTWDSVRFPIFSLELIFNDSKIALAKEYPMP